MLWRFVLSRNNLTEEIKSRCNIIDIVGRYVQLKKTGSSYKGLCPFHDEKTPSFVVSESKQFYNCFGCGESGDVISFVMKIENIDFTSAVRKLAEEYGIDISQFGYRNESRKNQFFDMNREAAIFLYKNLSSTANPGASYMMNRGLSPKIMAKFGMGFAKDDWHDLHKYLLSKGYSEKMMNEAGLVSFSKGRYFDKFRNRVMFPIINTRGKVIGFGGRTLGDAGPKYLNSPESPVFSKKNNLYGLNITRNDISRKKQVVLVEGYMDLVSLYQHGITNVAASLGTALTSQQCMLLKRYAADVVISYDADNAGQKAALRAIELLRTAGLNARVLRIPDGKDPDEFINRHGKEEFEELIEKAMPYAEYRIFLAREKYDITNAQGRISFLKDVSRTLMNMSPVESDVYIKSISLELGISESALRREINRETEIASTQNRGMSEFEAERKNEISSAAQASNRATEGDESLQLHFLKLMIISPHYIKKVKDKGFIFEDPGCRRIYKLLESLYNDYSKIDIRMLEDSIIPEDSEIYEKIAKLRMDKDSCERVFDDCCAAADLAELKKRQYEILEIMNLSVESGSDGEQEKKLAEELMDIRNRINKLKGL